MTPSDFFVEEQLPVSDSDPWGGPAFRVSRRFNADLVGRLRQGPADGYRDVDVAHALAQLAYDELLAYGTAGDQVLTNNELVLVMRSLRVVLGRLGIKFDPPFRDYKGFHGYWQANGMSGSWAARRAYLSELFNPILSRIEAIDDAELRGQLKGVDGKLKNIIFASTGPKPRIVLKDALDNIIEIVENGEFCLVYDRPLGPDGLSWADLVDWWRGYGLCQATEHKTVARDLYKRLLMSMTDSPAERVLFRSYCRRYANEAGQNAPALLPQVYLHYDPYTRKQRGTVQQALARERMDFLLLMPNGVRVVLEVDGKHHYAEGDIASPRLYARMAAEDRSLRLRGYEVFRFGGYELTDSSETENMLQGFFDQLLDRYGS